MLVLYIIAFWTASVVFGSPPTKEINTMIVIDYIVGRMSDRGMGFAV